MYPFRRLLLTVLAARKQGALDIHDIHVSHHRCMPWDLDGFLELNNGRTLTLYDLGRFGAAQRVGLIDVLKRERWALTVAGSSVRYRKRVRLWDRIEMRTRLTGWDDRFFYLEQSMWVRGSCTSHALLRTAVTDRNGVVVPDRVKAALGVDDPSRPLPDWIAAWTEAEAQRPWPPMQDVPS